MKAAVFLKKHHYLAESPVWDASRKGLWWTDILDSKIFFWNPDLDSPIEYNLPVMVGSLSLTIKHDLILATDKGFYRFHPEKTKLTFHHHPENHKPNNRFNDGKVDPYGRFWAGSMDKDIKKNSGTLYRLDSDLKSKAFLSQIKISNGLAWDKTKKLFYFIDTPTHKIQIFKFSEDNFSLIPEGFIENQGPGFFDGMSIDQEGNLWVAKFNGASIEIYDPLKKRLLNTLSIPTEKVTSCCFGGPDFSKLYITTASFNDPEKTEDELAGSLFVYQTNTCGFSYNFITS